MKLFTKGNGNQSENRKIACKLFEKIYPLAGRTDTRVIYILGNKFVRVSAYTDSAALIRGTPKKGEFSNFKLKGLPAWKEDEVHMFRDDGIKMHHYVIRDIRALADKQGIDGVPPTTVTWGNVEKVCVKYEKLGKKQLEILNYFK